MSEPAAGLSLAAAPALTAPRRLRASWRQRCVDALSSYLPLLLMGFLAVGTWWLVKNTPMPDAAQPAAAARHEPDYTMNNFTVQRFGPTGVLGAQIEGDQMRHYPDTDTLEIDNARIRAISPERRVTLASARRALSNADGSEVQLLGGAHVTREAQPGEEVLDFRGEFLHAFMNTERLSSHLPVTVIRGGTELRAESMEYNHLDRVVQLKGKVRASFASPRGKAVATAAKGR